MWPHKRSPPNTDIPYSMSVSWNASIYDMESTHTKYSHLWIPFTDDMRFVQPIPLQYPQATEHSRPCFLQLHFQVSQFTWQLQHITSSSGSTASGKSVVLGSKEAWLSIHAHSSGFKEFPSHAWHWKYVLALRYWAAAAVGGRVCTCTKEWPLMAFSQNFL